MIGRGEPRRGITAAEQSKAGREWLLSLPSLIATMSSKWGLDVEAGKQHSGFNAVVLRATRNGHSCVLKLDWPVGQVEDEAKALGVWRGDGCVLLLESDSERGALLLEALDPGRTLKSLSVMEAGGVAGELIRKLAVRSPGGFRTLNNRAAEIEAMLSDRQSRLDSPVPARWLSEAVEFARGLGSKAEEWMVHGDLHYGNVLAGDRAPWLAIDPKPIAGDPEFAVPELMWTRADELDHDSDVRELMATLVASGGLRESVARGWTIVRCVDYWLWGLENGLTEDPKRCERILSALV